MEVILSAADIASILRTLSAIPDYADWKVMVGVVGYPLGNELGTPLLDAVWDRALKGMSADPDHKALRARVKEILEDCRIAVEPEEQARE